MLRCILRFPAGLFCRRLATRQFEPYRNTVVGPGDPAAQCRRVFADLRKTLDLAGATFENVVYVRAYLTHKAVLPVLRRVAGEIFGSNRPAFTPVIVASVRAEGALVEIELVVELDP